MSEATEVAAMFGAAFPNDDAVAAIESESFRDRLAPLEALAWPDFEIAMVGANPSVRLESKGFDGLLESWRDWLSPFETYRTEIEGVEDADDRAVILVRQVARPRGSDGEVENLGAAVVWTRDRKLSRLEFHINRDEARRAAGLD